MRKKNKVVRKIIEAQEIRFDWVPLKRIGPFKFNDLINNYSKYDLNEIKEEYVPEVDWIVFSLSNFDFRLYVENGIIDSIGCYEECIYKKTNLIGVSLNELTNILGEEPDESSKEETDDGICDIYEFDKFSAQVRVKSGITESIIFSGAYEDE